jgi:hypothetical protein
MSTPTGLTSANVCDNGCCVQVAVFKCPLATEAKTSASDQSARKERRKEQARMHAKTFRDKNKASLAEERKKNAAILKAAKKQLLLNSVPLPKN